MSHSAGRSERVVISTRRSRTGGAGGVDLNQQLLPSPLLQAEEDTSHCPALRTRRGVLGSSAGRQNLGNHSGAAVFLYTPSPSYSSRKTLCRAAVAKNAQQAKGSTGSSSSPVRVFVLGQELVQVEVQILVELVSKWILSTCIANS